MSSLKWKHSTKVQITFNKRAMRSTSNVTPVKSVYLKRNNNVMFIVIIININWYEHF